MSTNFELIVEQLEQSQIEGARRKEAKEFYSNPIHQYWSLPEYYPILPRYQLMVNLLTVDQLYSMKPGFGSEKHLQDIIVSAFREGSKNTS